MRAWLLLALLVASGTGVGAGLTASDSAAVDATGLVWSAAEAVSEADAATVQAEAQLAVDTDGSLHAVWIDDRYGGRDVLYSRYPTDGGGWAAAVRVSSPGAGTRSSPTVAVDSIGNVHLAWLDVSSGQSELWHCLIPIHGTSCTLAGRIPLGEGRSAPQQPVMAADPWGTVHLVWVDHRGPSQLRYARRPYGGRWSVGVPVAAGALPQRNPALSVTRLGDLYLLWEEAAAEGSAIRASRLPPGGDVWWPAAELARSAGAARPARPAVAADSQATVRAAWLAGEGRTALETAELRAEEGEWRPARVLYRVREGTIESLAVAGGPGAQGLMVWLERGPAGGQLLAVATGGEEETPVAVAHPPFFDQPQAPLAAIDAGSIAHALWVARRHDGPWRLLHARAQLPTPTYPTFEYEGWLQYRWAEWNCRGDGYAVVDCRGSSSPLIRAGEVDLLPLVGQYVSLTVVKVEDTPCVHGRALRAVSVASKCPRATGAITGRVTFLGRPAVWELVAVGDRLAPTGDSGRFFLDDLPPARYVVTTSVSCGLTARLDGVVVEAGETVHLEPVALVPGEVIPDCRVDIRDLARVTALYKSAPPYGPPCADQNGDGGVNLADIAIVAANLGQRCPTTWPTGASPARESRWPAQPSITAAVSAHSW